MKDPRRLIEEGDALEVELLRAGRGDAMPEQSGRAILGGLGLASSVAASTAAANTAGAGTTAGGAAGTSGAGAATGTAAVTGKLFVLKTALVVAAVGAACALAFWGGGHWFEGQAPTPPPSASEVAKRTPVGPRPRAESKPPAVVPEAAKEEVRREAERPGRPMPVKKVDPLALELKILDRARSALARGDHALASRLLDRYAARFPKPRLQAEATVLRIETLVAQGDRAAAARFGRAFLARAPNGPYARRVRSLIGDGAPGGAASSGQR